MPTDPAFASPGRFWKGNVHTHSDLSDGMRARWAEAQDFMKMGRWMMFPIRSQADLDDYKRLMAVKLAPKARQKAPSAETKGTR